MIKGSFNQLEDKNIYIFSKGIEFFWINFISKHRNSVEKIFFFSRGRIISRDSRATRHNPSVVEKRILILLRKCGSRRSTKLNQFVVLSRDLSVKRGREGNRVPFIGF